MSFTEPGAARARIEGNMRWLVPLALFVSFLVSYMNRQNMSVLLPAMARDFQWTTAQVGRYGGVLLTVFFVGYGLSNIFLSPVAARFGPRRSLLTILVLFSCFTMLGAPVGASVIALAATRLLVGVSQGVHVPMMTSITKRWFPLHERSRANAFWIGGMLLSPLFAPLLLVPLADRFGWQLMLVAVGAGGLVLALPFVWYLVYDTPGQAPWMTPTEAAHIAAAIEPDPPGDTSWGFLSRWPFWVALLGGILNNFCAFGVMMWLPTYFSEGRGLPFAQLQYAASLPYVIGIIGIPAMAWVGDKLSKRALLAGIGSFLMALAVYKACMAPTLSSAIVFFSAAVLFQSAYGAHEFALLQRILPHASISKGTGLYNGLAVILGGGLSSVVIGGMVSITGSYSAGMLTIVGCSVLAGVTLLVLARLLRY